MGREHHDTLIPLTLITPNLFIENTATHNTVPGIRCTIF